MGPRLVVTRGNDRGREYELRRAETAVGRGRSSHIVLTDPQVSRHHLSVFVDTDGVRARDEGSGNGTLRNGARFAGEVRLAFGDELELGDTVLRLVEASARALADPQAEKRIPAVRERRHRRELRPVVLLGAAIIAVAALGVVVVAMFTRGDPPPPLVAPPVATVAPPPVVISSLPDELPPKVVVVEPPPRRRRATTTGGERPAPASGVLRSAAVHYAAKQFADAVRVLRDGGGDDAASIAKDYALVGAGLARGDANADAAPQVALAAYQDALAADARSGDGVHATLLRTRIAKVAPGAAKVYLDAGRLEQARGACDLAVNHGNGGDVRVGQTRARLEEAAAELYARAHALADKDLDEARLLYRRVVRIVPAESPWSSKALAAMRD